MKEQVRWNTAKGEVTVTAELILSEKIWADGHEAEVKCCEMRIRADVEGVGVVATSAPYKPSNLPAGVVAVMGGKLGLNQERYDLVMAAIAKLEATPEWQAKMAAQKQAMAIEREMDAHRAKMTRIMGQ